MARLIDADNLMLQVKAIHDAVDTSGINNDYNTGFHSATSQIQGLIASTIEAELVKQEWISVKDRLPEVGRKVLVCDVDAEPDVKHNINTFTLECDEDGYFWSDEFEWWNEFENVTHWMPLPDPPKE